MDEMVSIIVPVYNADKYLERCLESILKQTWNASEIILVNDGSTDNSEKICQRYSQKESRIRYVEQPNKGVSSARNAGIELAQGKFLLFIDADDSIGSGYVSALMKSMKEYDSDMVICFIKRSGGDIWRAEPGLICMEPLDDKKFLEINHSFLLYGPVNKLYKTSIIEENNIRFPDGISYGEDMIFNFKYIREAKRLSVTDEAVYFYSDNNQNSLSQKYREDFFENGLLLHNTMKDYLDERGLNSREYRELLYGRLFDMSYNAIFLSVSSMDSNFFQRYSHVRHILTNVQVQECYPYIRSGKYGKIIPALMGKRLSILLVLYIKLGKIKTRFHNMER